MIQGGGGAGILGEDLGCREGELSRGWDGPLPGWALVWLELDTLSLVDLGAGLGHMRAVPAQS